VVEVLITQFPSDSLISITGVEEVAACNQHLLLRFLY
jgi:hypothetical protein